MFGLQCIKQSFPTCDSPSFGKLQLPACADSTRLGNTVAFSAIMTKVLQPKAGFTRCILFAFFDMLQLFRNACVFIIDSEHLGEVLVKFEFIIKRVLFLCIFF